MNLALSTGCGAYEGVIGAPAKLTVAVVGSVISSSRIDWGIEPIGTSNGVSMSMPRPGCM